MMLSLSSSKTGTERKRPAAMSARICRPTAISSCLRGLGRVRLTRSVSPMPRERSCSKATRVLTIPSGGMPASVTPRCSGTSGRGGGEARVRLDHLARVRVLEADHVAREAQVVEEAQCSSADSTMAATSSSGVARLRLGVHAAAVDAHAEGAVVLARDLRQEAHLLAHRLVLLVVVEVARVVADLVHVGRDLRRQAVVLLQVHHQVGGRLPADLRQRLHVLGAVHGHADEVPARLRGWPPPARPWRRRPACASRTCSGRRPGGRRRS